MMSIPETIPPKVSARDLAILFNVSETRISQMKRKGLLKPDADNMYSVAQAKQARNFQMSQHGIRVVAQEYSNRTGKVAPAKVVPTTDTDLSEEDREVLGIEVDVAQATPSPNSQFAAAARISELREKMLRVKVEREEVRARKELGELVERAVILTSFVSAGAQITGILQNLPAEIASIFADPDKKAEVRLKVQTRVDQAQHILYKALKDTGEDEPPDALD